MTDYLEQGTQTKFTDLVYEHAERAKKTEIDDPRFVSLSGTLAAIYKTCRYISKLDKIREYGNSNEKRDKKVNEELKLRIFCKRDLDQILREGPFPTCSDKGVLFRGLMAAQGYPTAFVETFHEDFVVDNKLSVHVIGRVFNEGNSVLVDPLPTPRIYNDETDLFPLFIMREGLDSWDIGIRSYDDLYSLRDNNAEEVFARYEKSLRNFFKKKLDTLNKLKSEVLGYIPNQS